MTREFEVDRLLEDWLADGPSELPDRTVDAIVRQLDTTPQQRHGWLPRRDPLDRIVFAFGSAAAVVLLFVLALGMFVNQPGVGGPPAATPSPSPTLAPTATQAPSPEPEVELFVSERYGYTLRLPDDDWQALETPGEWIGFDIGYIGVDEIIHRGEPAYRHEVFLTSQPLPTDMSLQEWMDEYDQFLRAAFPDCTYADEYLSSIVDGVEARIDTAVCVTVPSIDRWAQAIWLHAGRIYVLRVGEDRDSAVPIDPRQEIEVWLERITLHEPDGSAKY